MATKHWLSLVTSPLLISSWLLILPSENIRKFKWKVSRRHEPSSRSEAFSKRCSYKWKKKSKKRSILGWPKKHKKCKRKLLRRPSWFHSIRLWGRRRISRRHFRRQAHSFRWLRMAKSMHNNYLKSWMVRKIFPNWLRRRKRKLSNNQHQQYSWHLLSCQQLPKNQ